MIESLTDINIKLFGSFTFKIMVDKFNQSVDNSKWSLDK